MIHGRAAVSVASYLALMAAWIYGFANTSVGEGDASAVFGLASLAAIQAVAGLAVQHWWAVLLPIVPIVLAVPAGLPPAKGEPLPIWFSLTLFALPEAALVAVGVFVARRRRVR